MKPKTIIAAVLLLFIATSLVFLVVGEGNKARPADARTPDTQQQAETPVPERQITAIYFLTSVRCPSCVKIETWSHEAVLQGFAEELESGLLKWEMINYEEEDNKHYVKDYGLITKSLVLVEHVRGKETRFYNLPEVWNLLGDQEKFSEYVTTEVAAFIAGDDGESDAAGETG